ncbi:MAG: Chaperone required for the assembly of the mitochondrial F1-ATPase [Devosia sp.]|nr:Chaperone required for the assembly of the mitochondrial F1-ATPase [Devosia sp.]
MRDTLEDADQHRDDSYGRTQRALKPELPKRFYTAAGISAVDGGFTVTLDGRSTLTPGRVPVVVPSAELAKLMAAEWAAQGEFINADTMPMVRLVNSAIESGEALVPAFRDEINKFAGNDMLLYRAEFPRELVAMQDASWDDALVRVARHFGVAFQPTIGVIHQPQLPETLARLTAALADETLLPLTALVSITALTGSGILAIALRHGLIDAETVWRAAHIDEDFQIGQWGEVTEAVARRQKRRSEYDVAVRLLELLPR